MILPFHTLHPTFWFILGGSLCEDLELFHSFKTSPRSSKSESGCESYACFTFGAAAVFVLAGCPGFSPDVRPLLSRGHLICMKLPDVRPLAQMSGPWPRCPAVDVQKPYRNVVCIRRMSGTWPDVRGPKFGQMSGPCNLFFCILVCTLNSVRMSGPRPGCPA